MRPGTRAVAVGGALLGFVRFALLIGQGCGPLPANQCSGYRATSIGEMRTGAKSGCFELSNVVVVARTASTSTPKIYIQDAGGGPFTAIVTKCSATSTHPCPAATLDNIGRLLDGASVTVRGYYSHVRATGFEEVYAEDVVDNGALLRIPDPVRLGVGDLARDARVSASWFQLATVDVPASDPLMMFDFSPADLHPSGTAPCPAWEGFAMIPTSAGVPPPFGCNGDRNPDPPGTIDPRSILIGRQFFSTFWASTDCACAAASKQHLLIPGSTVVGPIRGILVLEAHPGSTNAFQVFEPLTRATFPVLGG